MQTPDGCRYVAGKVPGTLVPIQCSRWEELGATIQFHAGSAASLGVHTEFRLLNQPASNGAPKLVVIGGGSDNTAALQSIDLVARSMPTSMTPLCAALAEVTADISAAAPALRAAGRTVSIIIASDGAASDGDVARALKPLSGLPCNIVVRLCTNDDQVAAYWNDIDSQTEVEIDVLDDLKAEAIEIRQQNPWMVYGEVLHRIREWGHAPKILDLLDERSMTASESLQFLTVLFGHELVAGFPNPQVDPKGFSEKLATVVSQHPQVFDATTGKTSPWINTGVFSRCVLKQGSSVCVSS